MHFHHVIYFLAALIPMLTGFVWYSGPLFGKHWVRAANFSDGKVPPARMGLILLFTYLLSLLLVLPLSAIVIHQLSLGSVVQRLTSHGDIAAQKWLDDSMRVYGNEFRTFKHGAFHGVLTAMMIVMPVLGIISLFERKKFSYVAVHAGYWVLTLALAGGILCQWL